MRARLLATVLLLLGPAVAVGAGRAPADPGPMLVETPAGRLLLDQGREHMLYLRLGAAEGVFERLAEAEPDSPAAPYHLAKIALWRAMILEQDALYEAFFDRSDALLEAVERAPAGPWRTHFRAEAELQRAVIHAKKTEYVRAAMAMRQAYNHFERNVERHPDFHESYLGMGVLHLAVGLVPREFRWLLKLMGFGGTVPQGLSEMERAATRSVFSREEAAVHFGLADLIVNESKADGLRYLEDLYRRYPESPITGYIWGFALLQDRRAEEAEGVLRRTAAALDAPGTYPLPYVGYYLGEALFVQNAFEAAARHFIRYLDTFPGQALKAQAALHAGLSLEMAGRRAEALPYYRQIDVRENFDTDAAARREAQERLDAPLTARARALLLGRNAFDAGDYGEAVRLVQPVLGDADAPALERAEAAYRSGRAYHLLGEAREAIRHYRYAIDNPGDPLAKWGPWAQFYTGEVLREAGPVAEARRAYERALAYDQPFEYHKALEQRAKAALEQL